jgi:hypothetical protein
MEKVKDPYSNYDLDDWQWEFLRRNPDYIKAYNRVEWLKKRLTKSKQIGRTIIRFNVFGIQYLFQWFKFSKNGRDFEGWEYCGSRYRTKNGKVCTNTPTSRLFLDLPSPSDSSAHYREKLLNKEGPVFEIGKSEPGDDSRDVWPVLEKYEIAVAIDTRYSLDEIVAGVRDAGQGRRTNRLLSRCRTITTYYTLYRGADLRRLRTMANRRPCGGARARSDRPWLPRGRRTPESSG